MKHQNIFNRLRRIEGQIRGVEDMISKDRSEQDIIIQLEAARSSLSSTIATLIESTLKVSQNKEIKISEEDLKTIMRFIKK